MLKCLDQHLDYETDLLVLCQLDEEPRDKHYYKYEVEW